MVNKWGGDCKTEMVSVKKKQYNISPLGVVVLHCTPQGSDSPHFKRNSFKEPSDAWTKSQMCPFTCDVICSKWIQFHHQWEEFVSQPLFVVGIWWITGIGFLHGLPETKQRKEGFTCCVKINAFFLIQIILIVALREQQWITYSFSVFRAMFTCSSRSLGFDRSFKTASLCCSSSIPV